MGWDLERVHEIFLKGRSDIQPSRGRKSAG